MQAKNPVRQTWFFQFNFSKFKYRSTGGHRICQERHVKSWSKKVRWPLCCCLTGFQSTLLISYSRDFCVVLWRPFFASLKNLMVMVCLNSSKVVGYSKVELNVHLKTLMIQLKGNPKGNPKKFMLQKSKTIVRTSCP